MTSLMISALITAGGAAAAAVVAWARSRIAASDQASRDRGHIELRSLRKRGRRTYISAQWQQRRNGARRVYGIEQQAARREAAATTLMAAAARVAARDAAGKVR